MYAAAQEKVSISAGSEPDLRAGRFADGSLTLARAGGTPTQGGLLSEPGLEAEKGMLTEWPISCRPGLGHWKILVLTGWTVWRNRAPRFRKIP